MSNNNIDDNLKNFDNPQSSIIKKNNLDNQKAEFILKDNANANSSGDLNQDQRPEQLSDKKIDPTHFGDWQINCKTIDF